MHRVKPDKPNIYHGKDTRYKLAAMSSKAAVQATKPAAYVPELDGIRGIAIACVMALHFYSDPFRHPHNFVESVVARIAGYGMWGVDLFFVLSGYLITGILWDTRGSKHYFRTFYVRRTLRIFPLYYAVLFVILVVIPAGFLGHYAPGALKIRPLQGWLWSYLANVYVAREGSFSIPYVSHFWTLAIEEHFYLFWPFVIGLFERKTAILTTVILGLAAFCSRIVLHACGVNDMVEHVITPCRLDSLCMGAFFALAVRGKGGADALGKRMKLWLPLSAAALGILMLAHAPHSSWDAIAIPLKGLLLAGFCGTFIVVAAWSRGPEFMKWPLRIGWLRALGKYSYGLYVFHAIISYYFWERNILRYFTSWFSSRTLAVLVEGAVGMGLSCLIAFASYELFELHFLRLKRFFEPARGPVHAAVEPERVNVR